ncbi:MAG: MBOAT family protein [Lachnospiraceae bacterium]|nr:MBOAT family protein [Lachnospiraceae bacterium]
MDILMPLGISFLTFQQIAYLVDSWRGETQDVSFVDYALFVSFFPKLAEGPIVLHDELIPQFQDKERKRFSEEKFAGGLWAFSTGLFKKVLLADTIAVCVDWGYANPASLTGMETFFVITMYAFQLYFDFSGYCDMAMGIAGMLNLDLPVNFNSPYKAGSIVDFWGRWHLTLTRFLRKYLYFPLGGSKKGKKRQFLNILIVFLVSGFWHGASWTFVLWGALHGLLNVITRIIDPVWKRVPALFQRAATFLAVDLLWVLFRADSFSTAVIMYRNLFSGWTAPLQQSFLKCFDMIELTYVEEHIAFLQRALWKFPAMNFVIVFAVCTFWVFIPRNIYEKDFRPTGRKAMGSIVMLIWSVMSLSQLSSFLYFNF